MAEETIINMAAAEPAAAAENPVPAESEGSTGGTVDDNIFGSDDEVIDADGNVVTAKKEEKTPDGGKEPGSAAESPQGKTDNPPAAEKNSGAEFRFKTNGKEVAVDDKAFTALAASMGLTKEQLTEKIQLGGKNWAAEAEKAVKESPYYSALSKVAERRGISPDDLAKEISEKSETMALSDEAAKVLAEYRAAGKQIDNDTALDLAKGRLAIDAKRKADAAAAQAEEQSALEAAEQQRKMEPIIRFREKYPDVKGGDLPDEVKDLYKQGYDLTGAYELYKEKQHTKELETELLKLRGNADAAARSAGSMQGNPDGGAEEDDFQAGFRQGLNFD